MLTSTAIVLVSTLASSSGARRQLRRSSQWSGTDDLRGTGGACERILVHGMLFGESRGDFAESIQPCRGKLVGFIIQNWRHVSYQVEIREVGDGSWYRFDCRNCPISRSHSYQFKSSAAVGRTTVGGDTGTSVPFGRLALECPPLRI